MGFFLIFIFLSILMIEEAVRNNGSSVVLQKLKQFQSQGRIYFFSLRFHFNGGKT